MILFALVWLDLDMAVLILIGLVKFELFGQVNMAVLIWFILVWLWIDQDWFA